MERTLATRNFEIHAGGELIGTAISAWATIDFEKRCMLDPRDMLGEDYMPDREKSMVFPGRAVQRLRQGEHFATVTARRDDHDINGHVNSKHLASWALESVPADFLNTHQCTQADMTFRSECHAGDVLESATQIAGDEEGRTVLLHALTRPSDKAEAVRMKTWWEQR